MPWTDVLLGGCLALAGTALQQALAWRTDQRRHSRDQAERFRQEQHEAFVDLAKAAHRVQRSLTEVTDKAKSGSPLLDENEAAFVREVDALVEAVAVLRLIVRDDDVLSAAENFEARARKIQRTGDWTFTGQSKLELLPLLAALQAYERGS